MLIVALAVLVLVELEREASLHRDVIAQLEANDELVALREQVTGLAHAARVAALTPAADAARSVERLSLEVEAQLERLAAHPRRDARFASFDEIAQSSRALVLNARSVVATRQARGAQAAQAAATEAERVAAAASASVAAAIDSQSDRLNRRTLAQIRVAEALRRYVAGSLAGAALLLAGVFALYRGAQRRERLALLRIEQLAHYDTVTGLGNRGLLTDRLEHELARAARQPETFALLMFDLDGFKSVNDRWGHAAGDEVLKQVGARARAVLRASDIVGRMGGDEFMAILPGTGREGALAVAEKLREAIAKPYPLKAAEARIGASVGVSLYPDDGRDSEALLHAADAALYEGKRGGKNRVVSAGAEGAPGDAPGLPA